MRKEKITHNKCAITLDYTVKANFFDKINYTTRYETYLC